jgi:urease accessory protein
MTRAHKHLLRIAALCLTPTLALAHPGHGEHAGFAAGALHSWTGVDHLAGFIVVGFLAAQLRSRLLWPMLAGLLGLLVATSTTANDGWQYASGFMISGASLAAAAMFTTWAATRLIGSALTAAAPRSPT